MALRVSTDGNVPQIQFNRPALNAGPWFPYLLQDGFDRLSDLRLDRPRATKSAGMKLKPATKIYPPPLMVMALTNTAVDEKEPGGVGCVSTVQ